MTMTAEKLTNFMLRIYDQYIEISKSSRGDVVDMDLFELWDFLEQHFKLPIPVLTTHSKCYSVSPDAQLQFSKMVKNYYSAIAVVDENNIDTAAEDADKDFFLEDVQIKTFSSKEDAIAWLKDYGPVVKL